ncbi:acnA, partial [Symbiodinium microadriaticum]
VDLLNDPLGTGSDGEPVFLKDIWPSNKEIEQVIGDVLTPEMFKARYANVFEGPEEWREIDSGSGMTYMWNDGSTYVQYPPFFEEMKAEPEAMGDIAGARALAMLGDSITTDHISPAGAIKKESPAGEYLIEHQEGGYTKHMPDGAVMPIYDAAMKYADEGVPLVVIGGKEYGTGSSRDWAAKGTRLLGVKDGVTRKSLNLTGQETFDVSGVAAGITPRMDLELTIHRPDGSSETVPLLCRIDTADEVEYYKNGGILHYVLRNLMKAA